MSRARRAALAEDRGSIMLAMLVIVVVTGLAAVLLPILLTQYGATRTDNRRTTELAAAQAGLDVAVAHIGASTNKNGSGRLSGLPCRPLAGSVDATGGSRYDVSISYFLNKPSNENASWRAHHAMPCQAGNGVPMTPKYAFLQSQGTATAPGGATVSRTLHATYVFRTTNANIAGGLIHVYKTPTSVDLCFDAGSASPTAGTNLTMQPCAPGSSQQKFAYTPNLTLVLTASQTQQQPDGMCLDAGAPHANDALVVFEPCSSVVIPRQQWSFDDSANFQGTTNGKTLDGYCFNVQSPNVAGSFVVLENGNGCTGGYNNVHTFQPDASVGAGAAGASTGQLVNFSQFGRCLDVTEQNVNYGYLIDWPCKQAPDPTTISWNQRWSLPQPAAGSNSATGSITTTPSTSPYCLHSPGSTTPGNYVTVIACPGGSSSPAVRWTVNRDTGVYSTSYQITDGWGNCLQPTDPKAAIPDFYPKGDQISKIVVASCNGSTLQKWNAPPTVLAPNPLTDIGEK